MITCGTVNLLGTNICKMSMQDVLSLCDLHIADRTPLLIGVVNVAKIVAARRDHELRRSLDDADLIVADGQPVVWLSKLCGCALPQRVAGIDIMMRLLQRAHEKKYSVYFLGAAREVVQKVVDYTKRTYPGVRIAGYRDGYFSSDQHRQVADEIRASRPDVLFVALPTPTKENFFRDWRLYMQVPVCHGVGGSFDVIAGLTARAPHWMQRSGLEWFYRLAQEPRRMWKRYLVTNLAFLLLSIGEVIRHRLARKKSFAHGGRD